MSDDMPCPWLRKKPIGCRHPRGESENRPGWDQPVKCASCPATLHNEIQARERAREAQVAYQ